MISYAGTVLRQATEEVATWIATNIPPEEVFEFAPCYSAGPGLENVPFTPPRLPGPVRVGKLHWPWGAQRFAVGHYLTTSTDLVAIRNAVYPSGTGYQPAALVLDGANGLAVTTPLWMLPPRPLAQVGGDPGMWLLTLVDDRFFWRFRAADVTAQSTWTGLYAAVGTALGVDIVVDDVPSAYLTPPADMMSAYHNLPAFLDGIALSVGQRIVRAFDGTVVAQNVTSARTSWQAQRETYRGRVLAGGELNL